MSISYIGVVHAEETAMDACSSLRSPTAPPFPPGLAPSPSPASPPRVPIRIEAAHALPSADSDTAAHSPTVLPDTHVLVASASAAEAAEHDPLVADRSPHDAGSTVRCTFVATICEDHFAEQQHFRYGACVLDGNLSSSSHSSSSDAFGPHVLHLVNLHGEEYWRGQQLELSVRAATSEDEREQQHSRRRQLQTSLPLPPAQHQPVWHGSGRGVYVERVLSSQPRASIGLSRGWHPRGRRLSTTNRSLLTICMQYPRSSGSCTPSLDAFHIGVDQVATVASYGRLDPPWDASPSRFYIVTMPELTSSRSYYSTLTEQYPGYPWCGADVASPPRLGCNASNFTLETISCDDFLAHEPSMALTLARAEHLDASNAFDHIEYLVPPDINCSWAGLGSVGSYNPAGNAATQIPGGTTWTKLGGGIPVRAHELGHNMGSTQPPIEPRTNGSMAGSWGPMWYCVRSHAAQCSTRQSTWPCHANSKGRATSPVDGAPRLMASTSTVTHDASWVVGRQLTMPLSDSYTAGSRLRRHTRRLTSTRSAA